METAIGMFAQKGYAGTSVREIAEQAGVSKPVLYYYFKSKGGLFLAILEMAENLQKQLLAEVLESQGTVLDRLVLLYRRVYEEVEAHQSLLIIDNLFDETHDSGGTYCALGLRGVL